MLRVFACCSVLLSATACASEADSSACDALLAIERLPFRAGYEDVLCQVGLRDSEELQACLVQNITNVESIDDPREAPVVRTYVKGDTAFMLLAMKYDWRIEDFLDEEARANWSEAGVYAYFDYVADPDNRARVASKASERVDDTVVSIDSCPPPDEPISKEDYDLLVYASDSLGVNPGSVDPATLAFESESLSDCTAKARAEFEKKDELAVAVVKCVARERSRRGTE
jgi:hypothetical protein